MPLETTTACVSLLVFFRIRRGTFPYSVEDDASTISQTPTTHYTNTCVKLTIVTHVSFSERIAIAKKFSMSPLFSSTIFDPDANSVLLRAHLCPAVDSMRRKPCVRNCSRKREGLFNGKVQQNSLCAASCVTKDIHISPRFSPTFFYRDANSVLLLLLAHLCTAVLIRSMRRTLCSKFFMMRA